jgi:curved DNA-binding protein CbpA
MEIPTQFNYYEVLEVSPSAPQHEIHKAYERAKVTYSGDNPALYSVFSAHEARQLLIMIEEAYSVLGNSTLRGIYDIRIGQKETRLEDLTFSSLLKAQQAPLESQRSLVSKIKFQVDPSMEKWIREETNFDGDFLRKVREYKNITLESMSEITKVNPNYIQAIESSDTGQLPAPVFVRGYVSQIAKTLNLDEKRVSDSYMKNLKKPLEKR